MKKLHDWAIPTAASTNDNPNAMPARRVPVQELTPKRIKIQSLKRELDSKNRQTYRLSRKLDLTSPDAVEEELLRVFKKTLASWK